MAFNPGRNIGRVSIRVLPNTKDFNKVLRRQLDDFAKKFRGTVKVDKVNLDRAKIREDMQRQLHLINLDAHDFNATMTITKVKLKKTELRKSIQSEFDKWDTISVKISAEIRNPQEFKHDVESMVDEASRNSVRIFANAETLVASQQLRFTARDRFVQFIATVNKASLARVSTALAALSGARLASNWIEDIVDFAKNLDKSLPSILNWTTGITSALAAVTALTGGLVGIGAGLFSITPALLVLPGLALNAIGSLTALIVAWRNAGTELGSLGDGMRELGDIINTTYWDRARQPILDLVNGLMPQLRNSFRDLSEGVGDFTGAMANAFAVELGEGRLESIFKGIADGWRVLGTGAGGFAGAIVSLSQIAATYTPRLAGWFVRQANTFDSWLKAISEDGRLGDWMETAIDSMYDLWDATTGIAGVFEGLWTAAEAAGSGGLAGFADMMQAWEKTVKGADFQRGMTAVFRGSYVAMSAFADGIKAVGQLVADLDGAFEVFIGSSGQFLGGLLEGIANALNSSAVSTGLTNLSTGLIETLNGIVPSLQPIADTFGGFLGTLGTLASSILPTAVGAVAALMPSVDALMGVVNDVVPGLADAATKVVDEFAPVINDLVVALGPSLTSIFGTLSDALEDVAPKMADLAEGLSPALVFAMDALAAALKPLAQLAGTLWGIPQVAGEGLKNGLGWLWDDKEMDKVTKEIVKNGGWTADLFTWAETVDAEYSRYAKKHAKTYTDNLVPAQEDAATAVSKWTAAINAEFTLSGDAAGNEMWKSFVGSDIPADLKAQVMANLQALGIDIETAGGGAGGGFSLGLAAGILGGLPSVDGAAGSIKGRVSTATADASTWLSGRGAETIGGFKTGAEGGVPAANGVFSGLRGTVQGTFPNPFGMLMSAGSLIMSGLLSGLRSAWEGVKTFVGGIAGWIRDNKGPEAYDRQLLVKPGEWIMGGLERGLAAGFGRVKSRVSGMADDIRSEFGMDLGTGISAGIETSMRVARTTRLPFSTDAEGNALGDGRAPAQVNVTMPLLPGETPQEQRDNLVKELQWAL